MKIQLTDIYEGYIIDLKERKLCLLDDKKRYEDSKNYLITKLEDYKHYLDNFTNIKFNEINKLDRAISEKSLIHLATVSGFSIEAVRRSLNMIVQINKNLVNIDEELKILKINTINESTAREIIETFNDKISNEILYKGYSFRIGGALGLIRIRKVLCDKRIKKRINWNESNKKKKELIEQGRLPFEVLERDENRKAISNNGGEHWFVYFDQPFDYLWYWSKNRNIAFNSAYFKFRPTIYNNTKNGGHLGNINKLAKLKSSNSELLKNYY